VACATVLKHLCARPALLQEREGEGVAGAAERGAASCREGRGERFTVAPKGACCRLICKVLVFWWWSCGHMGEERLRKGTVLDHQGGTRVTLTVRRGRGDLTVDGSFTTYSHTCLSLSYKTARKTLEIATRRR